MSVQKSVIDHLGVNGVEELINYDKAKKMSKSAKKRKRNFLKQLGSLRTDLKTVEEKTAMALSSVKPKLMYRLSENIENFLVFEDLLDRLSQAKKNDSYKVTGWLGSGLRSFGSAIRGEKKAKPEELSPNTDLEEALSEFKKKNESYVSTTGGNIFRKMGETLSGENTTLQRVLKRTLERVNPFLKSLPHNAEMPKNFLAQSPSDRNPKFPKDEDEDEEDEYSALRNPSTPLPGEEGTIFISLSTDPQIEEVKENDADEEISSLVFALLRNFEGLEGEHNVAHYYIDFLLNYGFNRYGTDFETKPTYYFDQMFFLGVSKYVFYNKYVLMNRGKGLEFKPFHNLCRKIERKYCERIGFSSLKVNVEDISYTEVEKLKHLYFKDQDVQMTDIRKKKEELEKRAEKDRIYYFSFNRMGEHWTKYRKLYEKHMSEIKHQKLIEEEDDGEEEEDDYIGEEYVISANPQKKEISETSDPTSDFFGKIPKRNDSEECAIFPKATTLLDDDEVEENVKKEGEGEEEDMEVDLDPYISSMRLFAEKEPQPPTDQKKTSNPLPSDHEEQILRMVNEVEAKKQKEAKKTDEINQMFNEQVSDDPMFSSSTEQKMETEKPPSDGEKKEEPEISKNERVNSKMMSDLTPEESDSDESDIDLFAVDVKVSDAGTKIHEINDDLFQRTGEDSDTEVFGEKSQSFAKLARTDDDFL